MPVIETVSLKDLGRTEFPKKVKTPNHKPNVQKIHFGWNVQKLTLELFNDDGKIIKSLHPWARPRKNTFCGDGLTGHDSPGRPWANQHFTDTFGVTPTKLVKIAKGILYEQVVKPNPIWAKLCRKSNWIPSAEMFGFLEYTELFEQCVRDGTENIIPLVALFGMDAKGLRELFGKNPWKKVVKNSYSRNRLIFINCMKQPNMVGVDEYSNRVRLKNFNFFNEFPSTLLTSRYVTSMYAPWWMFDLAFKESKQPLRVMKKGRHEDGGCEPTYAALMMLCDTNSMALRLNQPFDEKWSMRRFREEHQRLTLLERDQQELRRASYDKEYAKKLKINFKDLHKWLDVVRVGDCVGTPLLNMQEVIDEGKKQGHCVGGYAEFCAQGGYVVYSLEKNGVKSTLGIVFTSEFKRVIREDGLVTMQTKKRGYIPQQHYLAYNQPVTDADMLECAQEIVRELNERNRNESQPESK